MFMIIRVIFLNQDILKNNSKVKKDAAVKYTVTTKTRLA